MTEEHVGAQVKSMQNPDKVVEFLDGSVRVAVELMGSVIVGHGTYRPGWQ